MTHSAHSNVILNSFQDPWTGRNRAWMLKQVQHDGSGRFLL